MKTIIKNSPIILLFILLSQTGFGQKKMAEATIKTSIVCDMCKTTIEKNLIFEKGVKEVRVDIEKKEVYVRFRTDKTSIDLIKQALVKLGYRADDLPADPKAHAKLPDCCKKEGCGKD
ncbi:MAG TPA: cation transporter [Flavobacteriales bacterium]|nr:cation transporter [Flavobacteriales bacterium]HRE95594.1 cation transporter [Flavobacteriales bacterium]HRJ34879.1 cation transporter [Flavobacteriales bacterium]HRJ38556.1 cation transporter [Flavobacteriales bacterium]